MQKGQAKSLPRGWRGLLIFRARAPQSLMVLAVRRGVAVGCCHGFGPFPANSRRRAAASPWWPAGLLARVGWTFWPKSGTVAMVEHPRFDGSIR